jgi:hypothetical protein
MATAEAPAAKVEASKPKKKEGLFKKFCRNSFNKCDYDGRFHGHLRPDWSPFALLGPHLLFVEARKIRHPNFIL